MGALFSNDFAIEPHNLTEDLIHTFFRSTNNLLNEKQERLIAAIYARAIGRGGQTIVHNATGFSYERIRRGLQELEFMEIADSTMSFSSLDDNIELYEAIDVLANTSRCRLPGGGRTRATEIYPHLTEWIEEILEDCSYGDPMSSKRWTNASLTYIREVLIHDYDCRLCDTTISKIVHDLGFSLQANKKMLQVGTPHPDRDKQFVFMNQLKDSFLKAGNPVISGDTKKKEIIGEYANNGKEYRKIGNPRPSLDHDFKSKDGIRAAPYGIYVVNSNHGYVNVGTSSDTAQFSVYSIRRWWEKEGKEEFPHAKRMLAFVDGGGSNSSRSRLWKYELAKLAEDLGIVIYVCHFPPGTSKWNLVEHRLFSEISKNWAGKILYSLEVMLQYIRGTTTRTGLYVHADLDTKIYEKGLKISDECMNTIAITRNDVCPSWNYSISGFIR